jgi:metal-sulfur cluster biosynthetic enzyme
MSGAIPAVRRLVATVALVGVGVLVLIAPSLFRRRQPELTGRLCFADSVGPQPGAAVPESTEIAAALGRVADPELDLSIVDLGLVESLRVDSSGNIRVVLGLTTPECPLYATIGRDALEELRKLPGARRVSVRMELVAAWDPSRLSDQGKKRYREAFGDSTRR